MEEWPLPTVARFQEYDQVAEGGAEQLFELAKNEIELDQYLRRAEVKKYYLGLAVGAVLFIGAVFGAIFCGMNGQEKIGLALVGILATGRIATVLGGGARR